MCRWLEEAISKYCKQLASNLDKGCRQLMGRCKEALTSRPIVEIP